ncbi:hypothetical protein F2P81_020486 [Scophthalmus maximus]|uniref:Uncharacterized protein n=1 Tax=Scophthalmus maximus TaxID=52904 RepID=A0A6A4S641_SCOMX|nr:hypothetical protein F2P81_020486 [Scophthalmus maximus]
MFGSEIDEEILNLPSSFFLIQLPCVPTGVVSPFGGAKTSHRNLSKSQRSPGETFVLRLSLDDVVSGSFGAVSGVRSVNEIFFDASETPERRRKRSARTFHRNCSTFLSETMSSQRHKDHHRDECRFHGEQNVLCRSRVKRTAGDLSESPAFNNNGRIISARWEFRGDGGGESSGNNSRCHICVPTPAELRKKFRQNVLDFGGGGKSSSMTAGIELSIRQFTNTVAEIPLV